MKNIISGKLLFSFGLVLLFAFLIYVTMGYNQLARLVPLVVLIPGIGFAILQFALELRAAFAADRAASAKPEKAAAGGKPTTKPEEEEREKLSPREKTGRELIAIAWLLGFLAMIVLFGLTVAIPLFVLVFMRFFGRESWRLSFVFALACWIFVYGIFIFLLRNELYPGILLPALGL